MCDSASWRSAAAARPARSVVSFCVPASESDCAVCATVCASETSVCVSAPPRIATVSTRSAVNSRAPAEATEPPDFTDMPDIGLLRPLAGRAAQLAGAGPTAWTSSPDTASRHRSSALLGSDSATVTTVFFVAERCRAASSRLSLRMPFSRACAATAAAASSAAGPRAARSRTFLATADASLSSRAFFAALSVRFFFRMFLTTSAESSTAAASTGARKPTPSCRGTSRGPSRATSSSGSARIPVRSAVAICLLSAEPGLEPPADGARVGADEGCEPCATSLRSHSSRVITPSPFASAASNESKSAAGASAEESSVRSCSIAAFPAATSASKARMRSAAAASFAATSSRSCASEDLRSAICFRMASAITSAIWPLSSALWRSWQSSRQSCEKSCASASLSPAASGCSVSRALESSSLTRETNCSAAQAAVGSGSTSDSAADGAPTWRAPTRRCASCSTADSEPFASACRRSWLRFWQKAVSSACSLVSTSAASRPWLATSSLTLWRTSSAIFATSSFTLAASRCSSSASSAAPRSVAALESLRTLSWRGEVLPRRCSKTRLVR
mmetsp:Transcript_1643/g.3276  ORF Transcript_1643/g.3276 Transcript_1643/m.3276 type:complete len:562 (+) Transcript_1643:861-2546(+)